MEALGWVIGGCHDKLKTSPMKVTVQAATARLARVCVIPDIEVTEVEAALPVSEPRVTFPNLMRICLVMVCLAILGMLTREL